MKWTSLRTRDDLRRLRLSRWHVWFAWYPIDVGKYTIWLQRVNRRRYDGYSWEYRLYN